MSGKVENPKHWYDRADEMRLLAETFVAYEPKVVMLRLADDYDRMGDRASGGWYDRAILIKRRAICNDKD